VHMVGFTIRTCVKLPGADAEDLSNAFQKPYLFTRLLPRGARYMDANRSGGAFVHLRGRSSAVKLGRHVITYRKAQSWIFLSPVVKLVVTIRSAGGTC
jgi:hypothetical protein